MGRKGTIPLCIGLLLLAAALCLALYNLWDDNRAGEAVDTALAQLEPEMVPPEEVKEGNLQPEYVLNPDITPPVKVINGVGYLGTINFPTLNRELPVLSEANMANLKYGPCCYSGTVYQRNMVIAGHNYKKHFGPLKRLAQGDPVIFTDVEGNVFQYQVAGLEVLAPTAIEDMTMSGWDLSLYTCTLGGQTRLTVRCSLDDTSLVS